LAPEFLVFFQWPATRVLRLPVFSFWAVTLAVGGLPTSGGAKSTILDGRTGATKPVAMSAEWETIIAFAAKRRCGFHDNPFSKNNREFENGLPLIGKKGG
jgi:hypothetical protein